MDLSRRQELEEQIRRHAGAGELATATTAALKGYGPEVLRFLLAYSGNEASASDAFSLFAEGVWRGIGKFDWACSFRTWAFGIARKASLLTRRARGRRAAREVPLEVCAEVSAIAERVRTATLSYLRTERKDRFAELRSALPPADRALLILRVDRDLSWNECAHAMNDGDVPFVDEALSREVARLRKRFQKIKERLLEIGRAEGLVGRRESAR